MSASTLRRTLRSTPPPAATLPPTACALHKSGNAACWGKDTGGNTKLPASLAGGGVAAISAGGDFTCAILAAGRSLVCFGANYNNELNIPAKWKAGVAQVAAGANHACAVTTAGELGCW